MIAPWLKQIVILSYETQKFPQLWKTAKICPIYKGSGKKSEMKNYRPVALLPVLSKVLEKITVNQLKIHFASYVNVDGVIYKRLFSTRQHGYRAKMSCMTTILQMLDNILLQNMDGHETGLLMCDLSAAFDTVSHTQLLSKLALYGATEETVAWFSSYLKERYQYVDINGGACVHCHKESQRGPLCGCGGKKPKMRKIDFGVFQGSVLVHFCL